MYNTLWYLGSIIAAWTVFGTITYTSNLAWRIPVAMQVLMPGIQFLGLFLLPESPRWLCGKDRPDEAFDILVKVRPCKSQIGLVKRSANELLFTPTQYHANGDREDNFCKQEFMEIQATIRLEKENSKTGWLVMLQTPGNRKRMLLVGLVSFYSQCSGNGLVSYYLHDILDTVGIKSSYDQAMINGGLQLWSFLMAICFSSFLVDALGRRRLFMIAGVGMLISFSVWTG